GWTSFAVTPAKAGAQVLRPSGGSRLRGNDGFIDAAEEDPSGPSACRERSDRILPLSAAHGHARDWPTSRKRPAARPPRRCRAGSPPTDTGRQAAHRSSGDVPPAPP